MDSHDGDGADGGEDGHEHGYDEPGCTVCGLRRWLCDAHGVDEGARDKEKELHATWMFGLGK